MEHFDPRLKNEPADGFRNWYAVVGKINGRRARKIQRLLPLPDPGTVDVQNRIKFEDNQFQPVTEDDELVERLIEFVRANDELTCSQRDAHVRKIAFLKDCMGIERLEFFLLENPQELSFPTALAVELGIPVFDLIDRLQNRGAGIS